MVSQLMQLRWIFGAIILSAGCSMMGLGTSSSKTWQAPLGQLETLPNGLMVRWIKDNKLPRVSMQLAIRAGALYETADESGLHSLTASMLGESTTKHKTEELQTLLESAGVDFSSRAGDDFVLVKSSALSAQKGRMLELFTEILYDSAFEEKDFERKKQNLLVQLSRMLDQPSNVLSLALQKATFGDHPYGRLSAGQPKSVTSFNHKQAYRIYRLYYRPERAYLIVAGDFDESFQQTVRKELSKWESKAGELAQPAQVQTQAVKRLVYHKDGLEQTQVGWSQILVPRSHPDYLSLRLANMAFGGAFASRLNQRIRDDLGLTYSIHSSVDFFAQSGSFEIQTFTRHEKIKELVQEVQKEYEKWLAQGISEEELAAAKSVLVGQFPSALETVDHIAYNLLALWVFGVNESYLTEFRSRVDALSLSEVNQVIQRHFGKDSLNMVIYTDFKKNQKALKSLGFDKPMSWEW